MGNLPQFAWHVHHEQLIEVLYHTIEERREYISTQKPEHERDLRLRLLKPVIGPLPTILVEAGKASDEAWKALVEASKTHGEAWKALYEAKKAYGEATKAYDKASKAFDEASKAFDEASKASQPIIEQLHSNECPNCPWNGHSIFPARRETFLR